MFVVGRKKTLASWRFEAMLRGLRRNGHHLEPVGCFKAVPDAYGYDDEFMSDEKETLLLGIDQKNNGGCSIQYHYNFVAVWMALPFA